MAPLGSCRVRAWLAHATTVYIHSESAMKSEYVLTQMTTAEVYEQKIRQLEEMLKRREAELLEYVRAEKVMIAAGKVCEDAVRQAHDFAKNCP